MNMNDLTRSLYKALYVDPCMPTNGSSPHILIAYDIHKYSQLAPPIDIAIL